MSTLLERLMPAIEEEADLIRAGDRRGLCVIVTHADNITPVERAALLAAIANSPLMAGLANSTFATSVIVRDGYTTDRSSPFYFHRKTMFGALAANERPWVAKKWQEWAISIVRSVDASST